MTKFFLGFLVGSILSWVLAHSVVKRECQMLGGFYVNNTVINCTLE